MDLPRSAADKGRDGSDGQGNGRCSETLRERDHPFSQALLSKLLVLEAEIAHGQRAAAGLAARLDERHRCRVGRGVDRLLWKAFAGLVGHLCALNRRCDVLFDQRAPELRLTAGEQHAVPFERPPACARRPQLLALTDDGRKPAVSRRL